jgi:hypothetical protein
MVDAEAQKRRLYLLRTCGECDACCTILSVDMSDGAGELVKPAWSPCPHQSREGHGCTVYADRPEPCRAWACVWRSGSNVLQESERPDLAGVMIDTMRPVEGEPWTDALFVYETRPGGIRSNVALLERLAEKRAVVLVTPLGECWYKGPKDKAEELLRAKGPELFWDTQRKSDSLTREPGKEKTG